jgi:hypothetical protein
MKLIFLFSATLSMSLSVIAQTNNENQMQIKTVEPKMNFQRSLSEVLFFPEPGVMKVQLTPQIVNSSSSSTGNLSNSKYSREYNEQRYTVRFDHGIADTALAYHVDSFYANGKSTSTKNGSSLDYKYSGTGNIMAGIAKISPIFQGNIIFGTDVGFSPSAEKLAYTTEAGNYLSGGNSIGVNAGIEKMTSFGSAGGKVNYTFFDKRTATGKGSYQETTSGGNTLGLTGFAEFHPVNYVLGISGEVILTEQSSLETNSGSSQDNDAHQNLNISAYGKIKLNDTDDVTVKPIISYSQLLSKNINNLSYDKSTGLDLSVALAYMF